MHRTIVRHGNQEEGKESSSVLMSILPVSVMAEPEFESPDSTGSGKLDTSSRRLEFLQRQTERWSNAMEVGNVSKKRQRQVGKDSNPSPLKRCRT